jgi:RND family efflux transporter MFP subunit
LNSADAKSPSRAGLIVTMIALALLFLVAGVLIGRWSAAESKEAEHEEGDPATEPEKVASVKTAPLKRGVLARSIDAYGPVVALPGESREISAPIESRVVRVRVAAGQTVERGAPLVEIEPSPDTRLALAEAARVVAAADKSLALAKQQFEARLLTNQDLSLAQQTLEAAKLKLDDLKKRGAQEETQTLTAETAGIVAALTASPGQIVAPGTTLATLVPADRLAVRIGVSAPEARLLAPGAEIHLARPANATTRPTTGPSLIGRVHLITARLNPDTRMVDVFVTAPAGSGLVLDEFVNATITVPGEEGLLVPRTALLPTDEGYVLFTVADGKAAKQVVTLVAESGEEAEIEGEGLHEGDTVVVLGNFELEDGMRVAVAEAASETQPSPDAKAAGGHE